MWSIPLAIGYALFVWWFSTGLILALVRMKRATYPWMMGATLVLAGLSLWALKRAAGDATAEGAVAAFTYAILIWAAVEMSFLYGYVTGPRQVPMLETARGWPRFWSAFHTISHHEVAILLAGGAVIWVTWGGANQVAALTFLTLWGMRISAKLNLFLGAPNVSAEFLPRHLGYLASYFERGRVSRFFPLSVTVASLLFGVAAHAAWTAATPHHGVAMALVATLLALAIVEHWFLVLPIPDSALWRWALNIGRDTVTTRPAGTATDCPLPTRRETGLNARHAPARVVPAPRPTPPGAPMTRLTPPPRRHHF